MKRTFPRSRQRNIIKNYQKGIKLSKNADILIFLDYMMFLRSLAVEANLNCQEIKDKQISGAHVKAVLLGVLKNFRG